MFRDSILEEWQEFFDALLLGKNGELLTFEQVMDKLRLDPPAFPDNDYIELPSQVYINSEGRVFAKDYEEGLNDLYKKIKTLTV